MWRPMSKDHSQNARSGHWGRHKGGKSARKKIGDALMVHGWPRELPPGRKFTLTFRVECAGGRKPDSDNGIASLKSARDAVADWLGTHDGPTGPLRWKYAYRSGPIDRVVMVLQEVVG